MRWLQTVEGTYATVRMLGQAVRTRFSKLIKNVAYRSDAQCPVQTPPMEIRFLIELCFPRAYLKGLLGCVL
jgi:hypothetical protein